MIFPNASTSPLFAMLMSKFGPQPMPEMPQWVAELVAGNSAKKPIGPPLPLQQAVPQVPGMPYPMFGVPQQSTKPFAPPMPPVRTQVPAMPEKWQHEDIQRRLRAAPKPNVAPQPLQRGWV